MATALKELTIARAHEGYRSGKFTSRQVVEYYLERITQLDKDENGPKLNAILAISPTALAEADELDSHLKTSSTLKGPLHGIPVAVKDQADTKGITTTYGSVVAKDNVPSEDATLVAKLKQSGAIVLAKTAMPDWAASFESLSSLSGFTRNPYDLERDTGGSSCGTGAAIAADLALIGVGEDTGGSIRVPSSFCGLAGIRCTPGLVSRKGLSPLLVPQDTPGPMCRTVTDVAVMLDAMVGFDAGDLYTAAAVVAGKPVGGSYAANFSTEKIKNAKIGVLREVFGPDSDPECASVNKVVNSTLAQLQDAGTTFVDVEIPNLKYYLELTFMYQSRSRFDLDSFFSKHPFLQTDTKQIYENKQYHPTLDIFETMATGIKHPREDPEFVDRLFARDDLQRLVIATIASHDLDALAFPDVQIPAPTTKDLLANRWKGSGFPTNTLIASQALLPAVSVPAGLTENGGLPVGLELLGIPYREQSLLELAFGVEQLTLARRPPNL